ncbi:MAG: Gfo/Idh/MocA family protein [Fimbriimonas sp.]
MAAPLRVGIVGIGNISGIYLKTLGGYRSTEVVAVADLDLSRAEKAAEEHGIPHALAPEALLTHPDVDLVLNLTVPKAHAAVALQAVRAGKHVYNEKPLATDLIEAQQLIEEAKVKGVIVGCAPDTVLGSGIQTARAALDEGVIGEVVGAQASMLARGPEPWHPNPEFFYKPGGGPMLDMGPYYLTALVTLLGPVVKTTGMARASFPTRVVGSGPLQGNVIHVETPTHFVGAAEFGNGAVASLNISFDVYHSWAANPITIYGSEGTMHVPDPNNFSGDVKVRRHDEDEFRVIPVRHGHGENSRGIGVLDIAYAIREGRAPRASGELALHVLEAMLSFERSSVEERHIRLENKVARPVAMSPDTFADEVPVSA